MRHTKVILSGDALIGSKPCPFQCFCEIFWYASAEEIHVSKEGLSFHIASFGERLN